jgi:hypothetical protein
MDKEEIERLKKVQAYNERTEAIRNSNEESEKQYRAEQAYAKKRQVESSNATVFAVVGLAVIIFLGIALGL